GTRRHTKHRIKGDITVIGMGGGNLTFKQCFSKGSFHRTTIITLELGSALRDNLSDRHFLIGLRTNQTLPVSRADHSGLMEYVDLRITENSARRFHVVCISAVA